MHRIGQLGRKETKRDVHLSPSLSLLLWSLHSGKCWATGRPGGPSDPLASGTEENTSLAGAEPGGERGFGAGLLNGRSEPVEPLLVLDVSSRLNETSPDIWMVQPPLLPLGDGLMSFVQTTSYGMSGVIYLEITRS